MPRSEPSRSPSSTREPLPMSSRSADHMSPLGAITRGLIAGAVGTAAMDTLLFRRYRRGGGESSFGAWESSAGLSRWEDAPAPAHVGRRLYEGLLKRPLAPTHARL